MKNNEELNKNAELGDEALKQVNGGTGESEYAYRVRSNDWVHMGTEHTTVLLVAEDVDTNDGEKIIKTIRESGHTPTPFLGNYYCVPIRRIVDYYKRYGGKLHAMQDA